MTQLSARERKLVAGALLVAAVALVWQLVVAPVVNGFRDRAEQRTALAERYDRDTQATARMPSLRRAGMAQRASAERFVLIATNPAEVLRDRVSAAVIASGATLRSIEDIAGEPATARVRVDTQTSPQQLTRLFTALDRSTPLLTVEALTVAADEAFQTNHSGPMDVRFEVSARLPAPQPR